MEGQLPDSTAAPRRRTSPGQRLGLFGAVIFLLTGAMALTFFYVLRGDPGNIFGRYDIYRYYGPLTFFIDGRIAAGEFPYWNPLSYSGVPNTGNPQSFIFYPPFLLRSLALSEVTPAATLFSLCVMWALHLLFMGITFFYFARAHGRSAPASFAATLCLICSALVVRRVCEFHFLTTMAWLPAILLCIKWAIDDPRLRGKLCYSLVAALLLGLSILGGFLQVVNLMGVAIGTYGLFYSLLGNSRRGPRSAGRAWFLNMACIVLVVAVGSLTASATLLTSWELTSFSARQKGMDVALFQDLRTWTLKEFFTNLLVFAGLKYHPETIHLSGVLSIVLFFAAWMNRRRREVAIFALMTLIFLECSFGPPLPISTLLDALTPFSQSAYSRAWDFLLFPFAMLVAYGVDGLARPRRRTGSTWAWTFFLTMVGALCLVPLYPLVIPRNYLGAGIEVIALPAAAIVTALLLTLFRLPKKLRLCCVVLLPLMLFFETLSWNARYIPWLIRGKAPDLTAIHEGVTELPVENRRDADPVSNRYIYSLRFAMNGVDPLHIAQVRDILSGPPRSAAPHRLITNWEVARENHRGNLLFKRSFWLAKQYATGPLPGKNAVFPSATTVFLDEGCEVALPHLAPGSLPASSMSEKVTTTRVLLPPSRPLRSGKVILASIDLTLPHTAQGVKAGSAGVLHSALQLHYTGNVNGTLEVWVQELGGDRSSHAKKQTITASASVERMLDIPLPDYPRMRLTLTLDNRNRGTDFQITRAELVSDLADEDRFIKIIERGANFTGLEVGPLEAPRVLTYLDAAYPGWHVYVDGEEAPLLRTNEAFKGVYLPEGAHRVRFEFVPETTYFAVGLSFWSAGITLLLVCLLRLNMLFGRRA